MKKLFFVGLMIVTLIAVGFAKQTDADREVARTQDFIKATQEKTPGARIDALNAYIKKFPDKTKRWTILAYYQLAVNYIQTKNYSRSAKNGETALGLGVPKGEEARLHLILAESYGVKSSPVFNKTKALSHAEKAISLGAGDADVLKAAKKIKTGLTTPPPPSETPEQKIKRLVYQDDDYRGAISFYRTLGTSDKNKPGTRETYALALFKANRFDSALSEYQTLYEKEKKAKFGYKLAEIHGEKAKRAAQFHDSAVNYYLEAAFLFKKEENTSNYQIALKKAKHQLYTKYNYFKKLDAYNAKLQRSQASAQKNEAAIKKARRDLRKHQRHMRDTYEALNLAPPQFELDKETALKRKIEMLKAGGTEDTGKERDALKKEEARIEKEFGQLEAKVKARMES